MNSDRLSREYVIVDVTVNGEAPTSDVSMALKEGDERPVLGDFSVGDNSFAGSVRLLVAMSAAAADGNEDVIIATPASYPVDYGVWVLVEEGAEQVVLRAGTLTVE